MNWLRSAITFAKLFRVAAAVIGVSQAMCRQLISLGAPAGKVHYNPYGIDCQRFDGANPGEAPPVFLAVGRFVEKKAPQQTIKAFARVAESIPAARLKMIGDGPMFKQCRDLAISLQIADRIEFLGTLDNERVMQEMRGARCFVQHSVMAEDGDSEGTPLAILEAGASGLPVVSTNHAGIPDVVIPDETGFLVPESDVESMADYMLQITSQPQLAGELGARAQQRIRQEFTIEKSIDGLWKIIQQAANTQ